MWRTDLLRSIAPAVAAGLIACAGGAPAPRPPDGPAADASAGEPAGESVQDLLARLDVLIAAGDEGLPPALLAEARALRTEALAALAAGDDALARDLLSAAIALFGDVPR